MTKSILHEPLTIGDFLHLLQSRWKFIAATTVLVTSVAVLYAFLSQPVYRSEVLIAPARSDSATGGLSALASQIGGVASLAGVNLSNSGDDSERSYAILTSRQFTRMFVEEMNLLPELFRDDWDADENAWKMKVADDPPTLADAVEKFDKKIRSVSRNNQTGFVVVSIDWYDPQLAAQWANGMIEQLNAYLKQKDTVESQENIAYLRAEFEKTSITELRQAISRLIEQQIQGAMVANVRDEYAFNILDPAVPAQLDDPVRPKRLLLLVTGLLLGLMLSLVLVLVQEQQNKSVRDQ